MFKIISILVILLSPFGAMAHEGATGIVKARMDMFKASQADMKAIAAGLKNKEIKSVIIPAEQIADWADQMVDYFPQGSNQKPSEALDNIWQEPDVFADMARANGAAARRLAMIAQSEEHRQIKSAFSELIGSCKTCHQRFRQ